jgi:hypothetical protein
MLLGTAGAKCLTGIFVAQAGEFITAVDTVTISCD